jgi:hypothetical protein
VIVPFFAVVGARTDDGDKKLAKNASDWLPPLPKKDGQYDYPPTENDDSE